MGRPKQLLPLGDKPVIRHCLDAVIAAGIRDIVVVAGAHNAAITEVLRNTPAQMVQNDDPDSQMADSVRMGLRAINEPFSGVLICLSDHPLVQMETIKAVVSRHNEEPDRIIIPACGGKRGHPTLLPREIIDEIFFAPSLLDIIKKDAGRVRVLEVADDGILQNMNTEEDYRKACEKFNLKNRIA